jgi:hypothetical protein
VKAKLLAFFTAFKTDLIDTYKRSKIFLLGILLLVVAFEWTKLKEFLLTYMGQREMKQTTAKDDTLKAQEGALNASADALVKDANALPDSQKPVTDPNWYKK